MTKIKTFVLSLSLLLTPCLTEAATINLLANMDGAQSGTASPGYGTAAMIYDDTSMDLSWNVTYGGLTGAVIATAIHGPALPGNTGGFQLGLGTGSPEIGSATLDATQAAQLLSGLWYINFHTTTYNMGEIRGQINVVPLPSAAWLLLSGIGGLAMTTLRQKRKQ